MLRQDRANLSQVADRAILGAGCASRFVVTERAAQPLQAGSKGQACEQRTRPRPSSHRRWMKIHIAKPHWADPTRPSDRPRTNTRSPRPHRLEWACRGGVVQGRRGPRSVIGVPVPDVASRPSHGGVTTAPRMDIPSVEREADRTALMNPVHSPARESAARRALPRSLTIVIYWPAHRQASGTPTLRGGVPPGRGAGREKSRGRPGDFACVPPAFVDMMMRRVPGDRP